MKTAAELRADKVADVVAAERACREEFDATYPNSFQDKLDIALAHSHPVTSKSDSVNPNRAADEATRVVVEAAKVADPANDSDFVANQKRAEAAEVAADKSTVAGAFPDSPSPASSPKVFPQTVAEKVAADKLAAEKAAAAKSWPPR